MAKFKVGDKAEFIKRYGFYAFGDVVEIISVWLEGDVVLVNGKQGKTSVPGDILKLVEPKLTKNQRITALEKEVAELRPLKEKVEHLEQAVQQYFTVPGEPSTVKDKPKTTSQEVNDFQKLFSVLEADYDLGVIELPSYVFDLPDSYKERVFKIYQILKDSSTPNVYAYAILDTVRAAFDLTER